jgi:hypothetical protein
MKSIVIVCAALALIGCSSIPAESGDQFYTWVDASGQIRTTKRPSEKNKNTPSVPSTPALTEGKDSDNSEPEKQAFDASSYRSSEDVDKQLDKVTTFSWQENGRGVTQERRLYKDENTPPVDQTVAIPVASLQSRDYSSLLNQTIFMSSELAGRELDLFKTYTFSKQLNIDTILVEVEQSTSIQSMMFSSYVKHGKIALPKIIFLDERLNPVSSAIAPFTHFIAESWSSLAYMQGVIKIPRDTVYMLMQPSSDAGLIELGDSSVKMSDQGRVMFKAYTPDAQ